MAGIRLEGGGTGLTPDVKTDAAGHGLCVQLSNTPANVGGVRMLSENDPGTILGTPLLRSPETSSDWRKRVGLDTLLMNETLNYTAQNSAFWAHILTTMTVTNQVNGAVLNGASITTINTGAMLKSYQRFPLLGASPLYAEITALHSAALGANQVMEIGLVDVAAATTCARVAVPPSPTPRPTITVTGDTSMVSAAGPLRTTRRLACTCISAPVGAADRPRGTTTQRCA